MNRAALLATFVLGIGCASETPAKIAPTTPSSTAEAVRIPAPLGAIPVDRKGRGELDTRQPLELTVDAKDPQTMAATLERHGVISGVTDGQVMVRWDYLDRPSADPVVPAHLDSSFVVDYEEASVRALSELAKERYGETPTPSELMLLVHEVVSKSEHGRFDIASRVAKRKAGDCTEHSVLLAALGRAHGFPTRVAVGYVFIPEIHLAIGHAWTEFHQEGVWRPYDSAQHPVPVDNRYLVTGYIEDEGPAYRLGSTEFLNDTTRIEIRE